MRGGQFSPPRPVDEMKSNGEKTSEEYLSKRGLIRKGEHSFAIWTKKGVHENKACSNHSSGMRKKKNVIPSTVLPPSIKFYPNLKVKFIT